LTNLADRIEALGGHLAIDSSPGAGTTVTGVVPIAPSTAVASSPTGAPSVA
jgi:signal transduction histidine kinase